MKNINQYLLENVENPISTYINLPICNGAENIIDESLRDLWNKAKLVFKKIWQFGKSIITKTGPYILSLKENEKGDVEALPAVNGLTPAAAYMDGNISKDNTMVITEGIGSKITGNNFKDPDILKIYPKDELNTLSYMDKYLSQNLEFVDESLSVNEVKLKHDDPYAQATIVDNDELRDTIIENVFAQRDGGARLLIWGAPGIGKTAILQAVVETIRKEIIPSSHTSNGLPYNLICKTLSNETPDNFTLPAYNDTSISLTGGRTATDLPKSWLPVYLPDSNSTIDQERSDACGEGLLFLDELSRATPQVLNVILPLINEGTFNGYKLGKNWAIIAASNRMEDEESGQSELGNAMVNRFAQVHYEPTAKTWSKWANTQKFMSPFLTYWLGLDSTGNNYAGGKYFYYDPNEDDTTGNVTKLMCSPRSWTNAIKALARWEYTIENPSDKWGLGSKGKLDLSGTKILDLINKDKNRAKMILGQYLPSSAVDAFVGFLSLITQVGDIDSIIKSIWKDGGKAMGNIKTDILDTAIIPVIQCAISYKLKDNKLPSQKEFESFCQWICNMNQAQYFALAIKGFMQTFFKSMYDKNEDEDIISTLFVIHQYIDYKKEEQGDKFDLEKTVKLWNNVFSQWNTTYEKFPDYSSGIQIIQDYAESNSEFAEVINTEIGGIKAFDIE